MCDIPKGTVWISAELKGSCYEEERYCNSFSPTEKAMAKLEKEMRNLNAILFS